MCPGGRGALTPCVSWGWRGLKKKCPPRIISGTALRRTVRLRLTSASAAVCDDWTPTPLFKNVFGFTVENILRQKIVRFGPLGADQMILGRGRAMGFFVKKKI